MFSSRVYCWVIAVWIMLGMVRVGVAGCMVSIGIIDMVEGLLIIVSMFCIMLHWDARRRL